ncbi:MAG TPA: RsmE family RNA methyltransferase [Acidobacteriota bacterium]|jgi:16S rRNA (uracil1498-N3)-methyltransferase
MRTFFAATQQCEANSISLDLEELHHAQKVLRLKTGDKVRVLDGSGGIFEGPLDLTTGRMHIEHRHSIPPPRCEVIIAMALIKGNRWEWFLEKTVEIGATRIIPIRAEHSVLRIASGEEARKVARWRQIAISALKQSGQGYLPEISAPLSFSDVLRVETSAARWILSERGGKPLREVLHRDLQQVLALVGPEGGWSDSEVDGAATAGFQAVSLGSQILRAETAPLYLLSAIRFATD